MNHSVEDRLAELAGQYALASRAPAQLGALLAELAAEQTSVSSVRQPGQAIERHVEDSLVGLQLPEIRGASRIADLGAGAGFPGLVLAVALPEARVALVESVARKCDFMRRVVAAAGIPNAEVVPKRAEEWAGGIAGCDLVTARALATLPVLVEYAAPLMRPGGHLACWKGVPDEAEVVSGDRAAEIVGLERRPSVELQPAVGGARRSIILYEKVGETPDRFPRRPGMARKRPLA